MKPGSLLSQLRARLRVVALLGIAILPGAMKRLVYRWCFGYRIAPTARIGLAYLDCRSLTVAEGGRIGHGTVFVQCGEVRIGARVEVGPLNLFRGGDRIELHDYAKVLRLNVINAIPDHDCVSTLDSTFSLGAGAVMTAEHRIDFTGGISIGRGTILGGRNSSVWTHTRRAATPVQIGSHCYVGSEIRMAPGSAIPDCCVVGIGSVVLARITEPYSLIAGVPAQIQRPLSVEDHDLIFQKTRPDVTEEDYWNTLCSVQY